MQLLLIRNEIPVGEQVKQLLSTVCRSFFACGFEVRGVSDRRKGLAESIPSLADWQPFASDMKKHATVGCCEQRLAVDELHCFIQLKSSIL